PDPPSILGATMKTILASLVTLALGCATAPAETLYLVRNGESRAVIVSADQRHAASAELLRDYAEKVTGVKLDIVDAAPAAGESPRVVIRLGGLDLLPAGIDAESLDREGFILFADPRGLTIAGATPWGVEYGVF